MPAGEVSWCLAPRVVSRKPVFGPRRGAQRPCGSPTPDPPGTTSQFSSARRKPGNTAEGGYDKSNPNALNPASRRQAAGHAEFLLARKRQNGGVGSRAPDAVNDHQRNRWMAAKRDPLRCRGGAEAATISGIPASIPSQRFGSISPAAPSRRSSATVWAHGGIRLNRRNSAAFRRCGVPPARQGSLQKHAGWRPVGAGEVPRLL